jgi:drug/metabolite transporter (DMT)-like permease
VAAILGVAVLGEAFTAGMAVGFVLVLIGSALATGRGPRWQRFRLDRLVGRAPPP